MFVHTVRAPVLLQPVIGFWRSVWCWNVAWCRCTSDLVLRDKCRDSCGHGCANWDSRQLWDAGRWDLRLSCRRGKLSRGIVLLHDNACPHTARETQDLLHKQVHWDISEHPPYSTDLAPSDFLLFSKMKVHLSGKRFANYEDLKDASWITRRPHGMKRVYTNWCQCTSALTSKATKWKSRQRYVPQLVYSLSVLLLKNILVWRNVPYFMDGLRTLSPAAANR